jgi:hypothetical protein
MLLFMLSEDHRYARPLRARFHEPPMYAALEAEQEKSSVFWSSE